MKAEIVQRLLESGEKLSPLPTYEARLERLKDCDFLFSPAHMDMLWRSPRRERQTRAFVHSFVRIASMHGIPVYCRAICERRVEMVHAQFEDRLRRDDWIILAQIGVEACNACLIDVCWLGADDPAGWLLPSGGVWSDDSAESGFL